MIRCRKLNKIPVSMGIDTWAVDFVLLDEQNQIIGDMISYRDSRTIGMDERLYQIIPERSYITEPEFKDSHLTPYINCLP